MYSAALLQFAAFPQMLELLALFASDAQLPIKELEPINLNRNLSDSGLLFCLRVFEGLNAKETKFSANFSKKTSTTSRSSSSFCFLIISWKASCASLSCNLANSAAAWASWYEFHIEEFKQIIKISDTFSESSSFCFFFSAANFA